MLHMLVCSIIGRFSTEIAVVIPESGISYFVIAVIAGDVL